MVMDPCVAVIPYSVSGCRDYGALHVGGTQL